MSTSFSVVCYKSKTLKNGENPLMLQVSKNGKYGYGKYGYGKYGYGKYGYGNTHYYHQQSAKYYTEDK